MGFAVYINLHSRQGEVVTTNIYKIVLLKIEKNVYYKINFYDESKKKELALDKYETVYICLLEGCGALCQAR